MAVTCDKSSITWIIRRNFPEKVLFCFIFRETQVVECALAKRRAAGLGGVVDDQAAERGGDVRHEGQ